MDEKAIKSMLEVGETIAVEFKRCGNGIENDVYESVCSFLNRFGGDLFLGVLDNGTVCGVPENAAPDMVKNFISCVSNPALLSPTVYLMPEILTYEGKTIIHVHVFPSAEVHSFKRVIYDRVNDADVKVTATAQIAQMYIRKQSIFTEKKIFPYVKMEDLRLDPQTACTLPAKTVYRTATLPEGSTSTRHCTAADVETRRTRSGCLVRLTIGGQEFVTLSGTVQLEQPLQTQWLLASTANPASIRWEHLLSKSSRYHWMQGGEERASSLEIRPDGTWRAA